MEGGKTESRKIYLDGRVREDLSPKMTLNEDLRDTESPVLGAGCL